ncbi:MAG: prepilin peptidase [Myxococcales bacterium]|nr:prepilin peptidase [Myxococcales bacterium]
MTCVVMCAIAAVTDVRAFRIPNWLTFSGIVAGLVLNPLLLGIARGGAGFKIGLVSAIAGALLLLVVFGILGAVRFVGMGDVKLMTAVGALLGFPWAMWALAYVAIAGGVLAVIYALVRGSLGKVLGNIGRVTRGVVKREKRDVELHRIPYALAILVGASWAAAIKYFPALRIP